jgi:small subunit ribosomal protein S20
MANLKNAIKAVRVTKRKTAINNRIKKEYKTVKKQIKENIADDNVKEAKQLVPEYQSAIDKAVKKGVLKKNTASRYKSRIVKMIKKAETK